MLRYLKKEIPGLGHGLVVRQRNEHRSKILLFDRDHGLLPVHVDERTKNRVCHGAFLEYSLTNRRSLHVATNVSIIDVLSDLGREDIQFLHNVLELVALFMPFEVGNQALFDHLIHLYGQKKVYRDRLFKKSFLVKSFVLMDVYPYNEEHHEMMRVAAMLRVDDGTGLPLHLEEPFLDEWLEQCAKSYPETVLQKTLHTLI